MGRLINKTKHLADPRNAEVKQIIRDIRFHKVEAACASSVENYKMHLRHVRRFLQILKEKEV